MTKRVLITGCAGFIGSNLVNRCVNEGWDVYGVDDLSNGNLEFLPPDINFVRSDFAAKEILDLVKRQMFNVVFHLAAQPRVSYSVENPVETHEINVEKTLRLIDSCRGNVEKFVFASSSSIYGDTKFLPTAPTQAKRCKSPYALQKAIVEDHLKLYSNLYGLDSVSLRFFNVFGPNQLGNSPYATAVSSWLNAIFNNLSMRSDGDGSQTRDMCYVDNVVDACVKSSLVQDRLNGVILNVGCGESVSNKQILDYLLQRFPGSKFHTAPWRTGDVMHTLADISNTQKVIGYEPKVLFWEGLDRTIRWHEENWDLIKRIAKQ
jgi:nucleoside-diphosphate-sugar epimerase